MPDFALPSSDLEPGRPPQLVRPGLWVFAPNRDTQGGTAWWLEHPHGALLIDCPAWTQANLDFLVQQANGRILLTSREGHGRCRRWQQALGWSVLVQEQEAYLLPGIAELERFGIGLELAEGLTLLWTPGPTPGASVLLARGLATEAPGDDILFCGRLFSPTAPDQAAPLRTARSFHWGRWQASVVALRDWLPSHSPHWLASGAGLGALRGEKLIGGARRLIEGLADGAATGSVTGADGPGLVS